MALESEDALAGVINALAEPGDMVVCLGAGSISAWAGRLPGKLDELYAKTKKAAG